MEKPVKETVVSFVRHTPLVEGICPVCGNPFQGSRLRRYCSKTCQRKADWQKHGRQYNANRKKGIEE